MMVLDSGLLLARHPVYSSEFSAINGIGKLLH